MSDLDFRQNDRPIRYFQLLHANDNSVYDVSAVAMVVTCKFRSAGSSESLWEETATKVYASLGIVSVRVPADGLDVDKGRYEYEFTVTNNSLPETCQNLIKIRVIEEFGAVSS